MTAKKRVPGKGHQQQLPASIMLMADMVCVRCGCASGYGPPPTVEQCPCECHDTARLWWSVRPWRAER